jgi:hypothetical protein
MTVSRGGRPPRGIFGTGISIARDPGRCPAILRYTQYLSTAAKRGVTYFDALGALTEGRPWMPTLE